jgi:hypothetical protein
MDPQLVATAELQGGDEIVTEFEPNGRPKLTATVRNIDEIDENSFIVTFTNGGSCVIDGDVCWMRAPAATSTAAAIAA